jgi:outer membrane protein OmpA-like peptidoglycan-associated protein
MLRIPLAVTAAALLLAGCASADNDAHSAGQTPWRVTQNGNETDYDVPDQVLFRNDSAELGDHAQRVIAALADEARHGHGIIVVDGYTDTMGSEEHNLELSRARAQSVAAALDREGIRDRRIETHGFGETQLAVPTNDETVEPLNRRVVIRFFES